MLLLDHESPWVAVWASGIYTDGLAEWLLMPYMMWLGVDVVYVLMAMHVCFDGVSLCSNAWFDPKGLTVLPG